MERNEYREESEINLKRLAFAIWRRLWLILLAGAVCGAAALSYALFFITPTYSAKTQLYVNNNYVGSPGFSSSQISAAQSLADTYMIILESHNVLDEVIAQTNLGYSYDQVRRMVSAAAINETEVFEVRVTCTDYRHAALIANAIADILPDKIAPVVEGSSVRVVDRAVENPQPVGPNHERYLLLGITLGIMLSLLIIIIIEVADKTVTSEDYLRQKYADVPVLAVIPYNEDVKSGNNKGYYESSLNHRKSRRRGGAK